jgi:hypothetical protein
VPSFRHGLLGRHRQCPDHRCLPSSPKCIRIHRYSYQYPCRCLRSGKGGAAIVDVLITVRAHPARQADTGVAIRTSIRAGASVLARLSGLQSSASSAQTVSTLQGITAAKSLLSRRVDIEHDDQRSKIEPVYLLIVYTIARLEHIDVSLSFVRHTK